MCKKGDDEEMALETYVDVDTQKYSSPQDSLKESIHEMNAKRIGKKPRRSARDMIKDIRKDMENNDL
ncbi:hypothetical protein EU245_14310 [Lentibacillus lipolyticus]|nr:hypothetical protein EU245_14310 [Lentibacillus lipolyticus]